MNLLTRLAALVAALAVAFTLGTATPAHAKGTPVVTASDLDVTSDTCFPNMIRVSGLYTGNRRDFYMVETYGPQGYVSGGSILWYGTTQVDLVMGFCSDDLPEGRYVVKVDNVERGSFNAYRPDLTVAAPSGATAQRAVFARGTAKAHRTSRKVTAQLSIRGKAMPGRTVVAHTRYRGKDHVRSLVTNSTGRVAVKCPRNRVCKVQFFYQNLAVSPVTKVRKR